MQSIPVAMTWEIISRGRWALAAAIAGALTLPTLILLLLQNTGPLDSHDTAIVTMHCAFTHVNAMLFGTAILFYAQGSMTRMCAYPLPTFVLVAWRMLPAMLIIAGQAMVTTFVLNALFDLNWPLLGPALFLSVVIAWANAICWLMEKSLGWQIFALSAAAVLLFTWFQWHYGYGTWSGSSPIHYWHEVTVADAFTMIVFGVLAYATAIVGVARNRCGEPRISLGVMKRLAERLISRRVRSLRLMTPAQAYFRSELRGKGWLMPVAVMFVLLTLGGGWLLVDHNPDNLIGGFLVGGGWLTILGILGGIPMGNTGRTDSIYTMRQFTAVLPMSDQVMARITLRTTAASVLLAWLVWAVALGASYAILFATGTAADVNHPDGFVWWLYLPATLLGIWTAASTVTAMGLTGRATLWFKIVVALSATFIVLVTVSNLVLLPESRRLVFQILIGMISIAIAMATVGMFILARCRQLVSSPSVWLAIVAAVAAAVVAVMYWPRDLRPYWIAALTVATVYSLAVAPLAAFPLAISANRHR